MDKEYEYSIKDEILDGENGPEWEAEASEVIDMSNFFSEDYIQYLIDKKANHEFVIIRPDFIERFDVAEMYRNGPIDEKKIDFLKFMIEFNVADIASITTNLDENQKAQVYACFKQLYEENTITAKELIGYLDDKAIQDYYTQNRESVPDYFVIELFKEGKMDSITNRELDIIFESGSYELLCKVVEKFNLDQIIIESRKNIDEQKRIAAEKEGFLTGLAANKRAVYEGELNLSDEEIQTVVENGSATKFYDMYGKGLLSEDIKQKRDAVDRAILDNAAEYDEVTVMEAFTGLYFHNGTVNFRYDLETILDYCESEEQFQLENLNLLKKLHSYVSGEMVFDRPEDLQDAITELRAECESFGYEEFGEIYSGAKESFSNIMNSKLKSTMATMISNIEPEQIEGTGVKMYRIANQTEAQKKILMLIHTESYESAKKYYEQDAKGMCFSVNDQNHLTGFGGEGSITFGYLGTKDCQILSAYTGDGQTNQMGDIFDGTGKGVMPSELYSMEEYMENTTSSYNELLYKMDGKKIKPDYVITYSEEPTEQEVQIAEQFGIPIFFVDRTQYIDKQQTKAVTQKPLKLYDTKCYRSIEKNDIVSMRDYKETILPHMKDVEKLDKIEGSLTPEKENEQNHDTIE